MVEQHRTPCPALEDVMEDIKKHERELGGIGASMSLMLDGQKKIFKCIDELREIATRNETNIKNIQREQTNIADTIKNGLKDDIAKSVMNHAKDPELGLSVEKRFQEIEKVMWLPRMIDTTVKRWVVASLSLIILIGLVLLTAYMSASFWGSMKEKKWGETPGLMQKIEQDHSIILDKNAHTHTLGGKTVVESHDSPDGPPIVPQKK